MRLRSRGRGRRDLPVEFDRDGHGQTASAPRALSLSPYTPTDGIADDDTFSYLLVGRGAGPGGRRGGRESRPNEALVRPVGRRRPTGGDRGVPAASPRPCADLSDDESVFFLLFVSAGRRLSQAPLVDAPTDAELAAIGAGTFLPGVPTPTEPADPAALAVGASPAAPDSPPDAAALGALAPRIGSALPPLAALLASPVDWCDRPLDDPVVALRLAALARSLGLDLAPTPKPGGEPGELDPPAWGEAAALACELQGAAEDAVAQGLVACGGESDGEDGGDSLICRLLDALAGRPARPAGPPADRPTPVAGPPLPPPRGPPADRPTPIAGPPPPSPPRAPPSGVPTRPPTAGGGGPPPRPAAAPPAPAPGGTRRLAAKRDGDIDEGEAEGEPGAESETIWADVSGAVEGFFTETVPGWFGAGSPGGDDDDGERPGAAAVPYKADGDAPPADDAAPVDLPTPLLEDPPFPTPSPLLEEENLGDVPAADLPDPIAPAELCASLAAEAEAVDGDATAPADDVDPSEPPAWAVVCLKACVRSTEDDAREDKRRFPKRKICRAALEALDAWEVGAGLDAPLDAGTDTGIETTDEAAGADEVDDIADTEEDVEESDAAQRRRLRADDSPVACCLAMTPPCLACAEGLLDGDEWCAVHAGEEIADLYCTDLKTDEVESPDTDDPNDTADDVVDDAPIVDFCAETVADADVADLVSLVALYGDPSVVAEDLVETACDAQRIVLGATFEALEVACSAAPTDNEPDDWATAIAPAAPRRRLELEGSPLLCAVAEMVFSNAMLEDPESAGDELDE